MLTIISHPALNLAITDLTPNPIVAVTYDESTETFSTIANYITDVDAAYDSDTAADEIIAKIAELGKDIDGIKSIAVLQTQAPDIGTTGTSDKKNGEYTITLVAENTHQFGDDGDAGGELELKLVLQVKQNGSIVTINDTEIDIAITPVNDTPTGVTYTGNFSITAGADNIVGTAAVVAAGNTTATYKDIADAVVDVAKVATFENTAITASTTETGGAVDADKNITIKLTLTAAGSHEFENDTDTKDITLTVAVSKDALDDDKSLTIAKRSDFPVAGVDLHIGGTAGDTTVGNVTVAGNVINLVPKTSAGGTKEGVQRVMSSNLVFGEIRDITNESSIDDFLVKVKVLVDVTISDKASIALIKITNIFGASDFSGEFTVVVTAEDGTTEDHDYTLNVLDPA